MVDSKISDLVAILASNVADTDKLELNDVSAVDNLSITIAELKKVIADYGVYQLAASSASYITNGYLESGQSLTSVVPIVIPFNSKLVAISLASTTVLSWVAEVHINGVLVTGASLTCTTADSATTSALNVAFTQGDKIQVYCNGVNIPYPRVNLFFKRVA